MSRNRKITVERIEDTASFERLREAWTELLEASTSNGLFLTWEWLNTWWKYLSGGRRLFMIVMRCNRQLVAIAPVAIRPPRWARLLPYRALEFLGPGVVGSAYLDLILRNGWEEEAIDALAEYLCRERLMLDLAQLKSGSCHARWLAERLGDRGWECSEEKAEICPFIDLSGHSWSSYLGTLGREHRYNFRRRLKNLTKRFDVCFEQVRSEEQRREALSLLVALHNMRWRERGGSNALHTPGLIAFHQELSRLALERGWLRLFILWLDGKPAASIYCFRYGPTFYFYQSGFDPSFAKQSIGLVTLGLAIKSAIEEGSEECDLLHGDEPYKFHWARKVRELRRLELYPPHMRGLFYKGVAGVNRASRRIARHVLQACSFQ